MSDQSLAGILLVCDLDGTLLDSRSEISWPNLMAIRRFINKGGLFTVATGRNEISLGQYLPVLPLNVPAILYNGAVIYEFSSKTVVWSTALPVDAVVTVRLLREIFPGMGMEIYQGGAVYLLSENSITDHHLARERLVGITPASLDNIPGSWQKVLLAWEPEKIDSVELFLKDKGIPFNCLRSEPFFLEILPSNISKGSALRILIRELGVLRSRVVAMGDNPNDIEMFRVAGWGIAVANAHDTLKTEASFCCVDHDRHAVSEVIDWIERCLAN